LQAAGYAALRDIEVIVNASIVRLVGHVPSFHLKQVAQTAALSIPGLHQVHNALDVITPK
jgi:osmotically-inducible protein OsmY